MAGVKRGDIKKLLVLEQLPKLREELSTEQRTAINQIKDTLRTPAAEPTPHEPLTLAT